VSGTIKSKFVVRQIIKDYKNNIPIKIISKRYNHSKSGIFTMLKREGVKKNRSRRINIDPYTREIKNDYLLGFTHKALGKKYGYGPEKIQRILKMSGVKMRGIGNPGSISCVPLIKNIRRKKR